MIRYNLLVIDLHILNEILSIIRAFSVQYIQELILLLFEHIIY